MSILIKGMEMPPKRWNGFDITIYPDGSCISEDGLHYTAVPVPPHGRLIDADALAKEIEYARFHHTHTDGLAARHHVAEYVHFLKALSEFSTILPADKEVGE